MCAVEHFGHALYRHCKFSGVQFAELFHQSLFGDHGCHSAEVQRKRTDTVLDVFTEHKKYETELAESNICKGIMRKTAGKAAYLCRFGRNGTYSAIDFGQVWMRICRKRMNIR